MSWSDNECVGQRQNERLHVVVVWLALGLEGGQVRDVRDCGLEQRFCLRDEVVAEGYLASEKE